MQWTRIASGLACMLFAAWFTAEWDGDEFPFEPLIGFLLSFPAWIFVESKANKSISLARPALHPNDVTLGNQLRAIFTPETRQFLRDHNFGVREVE